MVDECPSRRDTNSGFSPAARSGGVQLRHDHGAQYISDDFQAEIALLGLESSPSFVRAPQGNGIAEWFMRPLKEQLLWIHGCCNLDELNAALQRWREH